MRVFGCLGFDGNVHVDLGVDGMLFDALRFSYSVCRLVVGEFGLLLFVEG